MGVHFRFSVQNSGFSSYMFVCLCLSSCFCVFVCTMQDTHQKIMRGSHREMLHKRPQWTRKRKKALLMEGQMKLAPVMKSWCPVQVVQCTRVTVLLIATFFCCPT